MVGYALLWFGKWFVSFVVVYLVCVCGMWSLVCGCGLVCVLRSGLCMVGLVL